MYKRQLLHWPFGNYYAAWRVLEKCLEQGKIRAIGISNFDPDRMVDLIQFNKVAPAVNQIEMNLLCQRKAERRWMEKYNVCLLYTSIATAMRKTIFPSFRMWACSPALTRWRWIRPARTPAMPCRPCREAFLTSISTKRVLKITTICLLYTSERRFQMRHGQYRRYPGERLCCCRHRPGLSRLCGYQRHGGALGRF